MSENSEKASTYRWVILFARKPTWGPLNFSPFATKVNLCTFQVFEFISPAIIRRREGKLSAAALGKGKRELSTPVNQVKYYELKFSISLTLQNAFSTVFRSCRFVYVIFGNFIPQHICLFNQMATYERAHTKKRRTQW